MSTMMRKVFALCTMVALGACGAPSTEDDATVDAQSELGSLAFALSATDADSQEYRLRGATFTISGYSYDTSDYVNLTVSSEDDPDADVLHERILAGSYTVTLQEGWYFERLTEQGWERVEQAVLLGQNYQYVYVYAKQSSAVSFRFGVDGTEIDFFGGDLDIGITVEKPDADAGA